MAHAIHSKGTALSFPARLGEIFSQFRASFAAWRTYRRTLNELSSLSKRELDDLGLNRSEIARVAMDAAYGRDF